jgi:hypothetical protein
MDEGDPKTQELQISQARKEETERELTETAGDAEETATHERRADKAAYLKAKLEERKRSEAEADG